VGAGSGSPAPIVYLDQCHWVTLSRARVARSKVNVAAELEAADAVISAAASGKIRLPLSAAHLLETANAGLTRRRKDLAETMLALSDGLFMSDPRTVRDLELDDALRYSESRVGAEAVFSTAPYTPFVAEEIGSWECTDPELPPLAQRLVEQLTWQDVWREILLTGTRTRAEQAIGDDAAQAWAAGHSDLARYIADNPAARDRHLVAVAKTLGDLQMEIARAASRTGLTVDELAQRFNIDNVSAQFATMPLVGRTVEILDQRLRNAQDGWNSHDLVDLWFLTCAAGYADFVVSENKFCHFLRNAGNAIDGGAEVVPNLRSLLPHLAG
jgi:hypothetical protein